MHEAYVVVMLIPYQMRLVLSRLEVYAEFCVPLGLDVVGDVLVVDGDDDLQVASSGVRRINGKVNRFVDHTRREIRNIH